MGSINSVTVSDTVIVDTAYGIFRVPNYKHWTPDQIQTERNSYEVKLMQLKKDWSHIPDLTIEGPRKNENITTLAVRYMEYEQFVLSCTGSDFWFIALVAMWAFIEWGLAELGFPIDGYVVSQIKMYKSSYQTQLRKVGRGGAFGEGWSPMTQVFVIAAVNGVVMIIASKLCPKQKDYAPIVMEMMGKAISGNQSGAKYSDAGTPKPQEGIVEQISSMLPDAGSGGGGMTSVRGLIGLVTGLMSGGGKRSSRKKKEDKAKKQAGPSDNFD